MKEKINCPICNKGFERSKKHLKYCSKKCASEYRKTYQQQFEKTEKCKDNRKKYKQSDKYKKWKKGYGKTYWKNRMKKIRQQTAKAILKYMRDERMIAKSVAEEIEKKWCDEK